MKIGDYELKVPFVTTAVDSIKTVLEFAEIKPGMNVVDLGSGDGRIILEFAKHGALATGYEIKPELVEKTKQRAEALGLSNRVTIHAMQYELVPLSDFDLVYIYGMQSVMGKVEEKLQKELRPGTKVISNIFRFPHWKVKRSKNSVHLYIVS